MLVAVVDIGANTARLLVATRDAAGGVQRVREEKRHLGLGDEIEARGGVIGEEKLAQVADVARAYARRARRVHAAAIEVLVTSPGRQATNGEELVEVLRDATDAQVSVLSAEAEGELAWRGAVAAADEVPATVGVCDVGGGSTQLVVGTSAHGPAWSRSVDVGSLRLTSRVLRDDPPTQRQIAAASAQVADAFAQIAPPLPQAAYATGGTARALRRVSGRRELDADELDAAVRKLRKRSARQIAKDFGFEQPRARTLTAGTIIVAEVQRRVGMPLRVARGGIREGAALELLERRSRAAG